MYMNCKKNAVTLLLACLAITATKAQVNLTTGAANFSLPIFSYSDAHALSTSVSLNYVDGNGLPVGEMASAVGTGWQLQFGGVIRREQRGLPDDQTLPLVVVNPIPNNAQMTYDQYQDMLYPRGYLNTVFSPLDNIENEGGFVKMSSASLSNLLYQGDIPVKEKYAADREQDIFRLNFGQGAVEFVIGKYTATGTGGIKILNDSKLKITAITENMYGAHIKTNISKFIVTGLDGLEYVFAEKELTRQASYDVVRKNTPVNTYFTDDGAMFPSNNYSTQKPNIYVARRSNSYVVSAWYLSEIVNPRTNKKIQFEYEQYDIDIPSSRLYSKSTIATANSSSSLTITRNIAKQLRLKKIVCSPQNSAIFIYDEAPRMDIPGDKPLKEIQIVESSQLQSKFTLSYGYFFEGGMQAYNYAFPTDKKFLARMALLSVQKTGRDNITTEKPFTFIYNEGTPGSLSDKVAPMHSYYTDHWGYSNNHNGSPEYPYNYNPGETELDGTVTPSRREPYPGLAKNGILKQVAYPMGGTLDFEYEQNQAFHAGQNKDMGGVRVKKTILHDGNNHAKDMVTTYQYTQADGVSSSGWGYEPYTYTKNVGHRVFKQSNGKSGMASAKDFGLSMASAFGNTMGVSFHVGKPISPFQAAVVSAAVSIVIGVLTDIFSAESTEYISTQRSNIPNEAANPLPFLYARVVVSNLSQDGSSNGKTVHEFSSDQDYPFLRPTIAFPYSSKARYAPWAYGLPKRSAVYDKDDKLLKETINAYDPQFSYMPNTNVGFVSKKWEANKLIFDNYPSSHTLTLSEYGYITEETYTPLTGHTELLNTKERVYKPNSTLYSETITTYEYNPNNYQVKTITNQNSRGETIKQKLYYPSDYTGIGSIASLGNANMLNTVVSSETWKTKDGQDYLLEMGVSDFATTPGGDIRPARQYSLETALPLSQAVIGAFQPGNLVRNATYIKEKVRYEYDADGHVLNSYDVVAQQYNCKLYDYDNRLPVAEVANAKFDEIAYTSFETDNQGGWVYDQNHVTTAQSPTGKKAYAITAGEIISLATNNALPRDTRITLWATASNVLVNGTAPVKNGPTINGWTFYEFELPITTPKVEVTGSCDIDELRLLPKGARMGTITYEPGLGKTSVCDVNNRIQYFEYDHFGRVSKVFDENRNIIKTYEYHQKN
jgi:hypothetical protein